MNNMTERISHSGVVDSVESSGVKVRILQTSACASCKVAGYCNASESKEKLIEISGSHFLNELKAGDCVTVSVSKKVANSALLMGFGLPFVILIAVLFVVTLATENETTGAVSAICALIPYYFLLFVFRNKIRRRIIFEVEK